MSKKRVFDAQNSSKVATIRDTVNKAQPVVKTDRNTRMKKRKRLNG